ncbi:MAG: cytochrome C biogenesis protein [Betaproteobacteria bacterium RIFCSPLOWO2_02_FULL_67_26]|nr:MAG: cytochrome C biogenesis protein [Betaproteobacteria bacterium RIFCSPLOWO2_02_FULL_67_26]
MKALAALLLALMPFAAWCGEAVPTEQDPVHEKRAVKLSEQLRCLVCQNQSIAESNAELAVDLRRQIRDQIKAGKSDNEIVDFMVQRYGDFVLYRPPLNTTTVLLWGGPLLLLVIGAVVLARNLRERRHRAAEPELTDEDHRRAEQLLTGGGKDRT